MKPPAHVVLIGIDGLRPDMVDAETTPTLAYLMETAAALGCHRSVFPSETRTALASLVTGATPGVHGVVANQIMVPALDRAAPINTARINDLSRLDEHRGGLVQVPTLSDYLARAGYGYVALSTGLDGTWRMLWWGAERHGHLAMNPRYPDLGTPRGESEALARQIAGAADGSLPDRLTDVFLKEIWPARKPAVSLLWFVEADSAGHYDGLGSPRHLTTIRRLDDQLAKILDWRSHQPERDSIHVVVASDHGQITIGSHIDLAEELRRLGFAAATGFDDGATIAVVPGRSPGLWAADPTCLADVAKALSELSWCGPLFSAGSDDAGAKGRVPGTFAHSLVGADHGLAPHLRVTFDAAPRNGSNANGAAADLAGSGLGLGAGHHGGLDPKELECLLVLSGERIRPGRVDRHPSGLIDMVPTLLSMLDLPVPGGLCGRVLCEVLTDATAEPAAAHREHFDITSGGRRHRLSYSRVGRHVYLDGVRSGAAQHA